MLYNTGAEMLYNTLKVHATLKLCKGLVCVGERCTVLSAIHNWFELACQTNLRHFLVPSNAQHSDDQHIRRSQRYIPCT
jgi:hypothetical protein